MIPRFGHPPRKGIRYTLRPGAYVLLVRAGEVLLTHQAEPEPEFQLPGGGIDPGEQVLPALHREVLEETGWRVSIDRRLGAFRRFAYMPEYDLWAEKLCHVYLGRPALAVGPPSEAGHTAVWCGLGEAALRLGNAGDRAFVAAYARSAKSRTRADTSSSNRALPV